MKNHDYSKLSTLESDFKRLVSNAKEINERSSVAFGDAERVRKAVSNLMVKYNPAYKSGNYQAVATPLPPTPEPDDVEEDEDAEGEEEEKEKEEKYTSPQDAESPPKDDVPEVAAEEDAEGEGDENGEDDVEDEEDEDEEEEDDEDEEDEDGEPDPAVKRRRPGRPPKNPVAHARKVAARGPTPGKADTHYENVSYKGLTFQQAQEKIMEELIRRKDDT